MFWSRTRSHVTRCSIPIVAVAIAWAADARAGTPTVGVEWENTTISVVAKANIPTLTADNKHLLCSRVPVDSFGRSFNRLEVTYDRILNPGATEARLELVTGPISLCDDAAWDGIATSMNAFLASYRGTLTETLAALRTADPGGRWGLCAGADVYADQIGFADATSPLGRSWDTQVNMQVALGEISKLYRLIDGGTIGLNAVSIKGSLQIASVVDDLATQDDLSEPQRGFAILYFLSRAFMRTGAIDPDDHATIKNRFGLFPKVRISDLTDHVAPGPMKKFIAERADDIVQRTGSKLVDDDDFDSFARDHFKVDVVSNPIKPYVDAKERVFLVMEARSPNDAVNGFMAPGNRGSEFKPPKNGRTTLREQLGALTSPKSSAPKKSCSIQ